MPYEHISSPTFETITAPVEVTVQATEAWGAFLQVPANSAVSIQYAGGTWTAKPPTMYDANGNPDSVVPEYQTSYPLPGENMGALVGRIGESGAPFLIGNGPHYLPERDEGYTLYFCINDDLTSAYGAGLTDNSGALTIAAVSEFTDVSESIVNYLGSLTHDFGSRPVPWFEELLEAAAVLDEIENPAYAMQVIKSMLGSIGDYGVKYPHYSSSPTASNPNYVVSFPKDHAIHMAMGTDWYWTACQLQVKDKEGKDGKVSILTIMQKERCVSNPSQAAANWTDEQASIVTHTVTATVDMGNGDVRYCRRTPNIQWPLKGGVTEISAQGDSFVFSCGADRMSGTIDVLPVDITVNDGSNLNFTLKFKPKPQFTPENAFFGEGFPIPAPNQTWPGGNCLTGAPSPGVYYSWPQLDVSVDGNLTIGGETYTVTSAGTGWIDHQMMMTTPSPQAWPAPGHYNGWVWQFFNSDAELSSEPNSPLKSFACAGFVNGDMNYTLPMGYGYYLEEVPGTGSEGSTWQATFMEPDHGADIQLQTPVVYSDSTGQYDDPTANGSENEGPSTSITIPLNRQYLELPATSATDTFSGFAMPWYSEGTFAGLGESIGSELPATYISVSGSFPSAFGYLESVGFEEKRAVFSRGLSYLQNEIGSAPSVSDLANLAALSRRKA